MKNIINFISNIDNSTYNKIRHSKSDAECRRYLKEQLTKQLALTDVVDSEERTELPASTIPEFGTDEWIDCCEQLFGGMSKSR